MTTNTLEKNKAVARHYVDELHQTKGVGFGLEKDLFALDYRHHLPGVAESLDGKGHEHISITFYEAIPDAHFTIEDIIAEADKVVIRYVLRGTQEKSWIMGIPPTGKPVIVTGNEIFRIVDGKIAEQWSQFDVSGLLKK